MAVAPFTSKQSSKSKLFATMTVDRSSVDIESQSPQSNKVQNCLAIHSKTRKLLPRLLCLPLDNLSRPGL